VKSSSTSPCSFLRAPCRWWLGGDRRRHRTQQAPERSRRHPRIGAVPSTRVSGGLARDKLHAGAVGRAPPRRRRQKPAGIRSGGDCSGRDWQSMEVWFSRECEPKRHSRRRHTSQIHQQVSADSPHIVPTKAIFGSTRGLNDSRQRPKTRKRSTTPAVDPTKMTVRSTTDASPQGA
jgi:hypothetical protein